MDAKWEVFETPDHPESPDVLLAEASAAACDAGSKRSGASEHLSGEIDTAIPEPEQAFEVFLGKRFAVDRRGGSRPEATSPETPFEKFNRLRMEVEELANDLELARDEALDSQGNSSYTELARGVRQLQITLDGFKDDPLLGAGLQAPATSTAESEARAKDLLETAIDAAKSNSDTTNLKYELYYSSAIDDELGRHSRAHLEERIQRLETVLGFDPRAPFSKAGQGGDKKPIVPLTTLLSQLEQKVNLLDENQLRGLAQKAKALVADSDSLARTRQQTSGVSAKEVKDLVRQLDECSEVASIVPSLIDRFQSVQEIHEHNALLHSRIEHIERVQSEIEDSARLDRELLENLRVGLKENVDIVQKSLKALS